MESAEGLRKLASIAKFACPETKVIAGGIYPTLLPDAVLRDKEIDFAVLGEGEYRLGKLLEHLETRNFPIEQIDGLAYQANNRIVIQKVNNYIDDLDELPPFLWVW